MPGQLFPSSHSNWIQFRRVLLQFSLFCPQCEETLTWAGQELPCQLPLDCPSFAVLDLTSQPLHPSSPRKGSACHSVPYSTPRPTPRPSTIPPKPLHYIHATTTTTTRPRLRLRHGYHRWLDLILTTTLLTCSTKPIAPDSVTLATRHMQSPPSLRLLPVVIPNPAQPSKSVGRIISQICRAHAGMPTLLSPTGSISRTRRTYCRYLQTLPISTNSTLHSTPSPPSSPTYK